MRHKPFSGTWVLPMSKAKDKNSSGSLIWKILPLLISILLNLIFIYSFGKDWLSIYCSGCRGYNSEQNKKFIGDHILGVGRQWDLYLSCSAIKKTGWCPRQWLLGLGTITEGDQKSLFGGDITSKNPVTRKSSHTKGFGRELYMQRKSKCKGLGELFWAWLLYKDVLRRIFTPLATVDAVLHLSTCSPSSQTVATDGP